MTLVHLLTPSSGHDTTCSSCSRMCGFNTWAIHCRTLPYLGTARPVAGLQIQLHFVLFTYIKTVALALNPPVRSKIVITHIKIVMTCAALPSTSPNWNLCFRCDTQHADDYAAFYHLEVVLATQRMEVMSYQHRVFSF